MSVEIYYFSGTGNSLVVARDMAKALNGKLIPIPEVMEQEQLSTHARTIGIVFPVYHQGVPFIVRKFIEKFDDVHKKYIFGICTYGDNPGISLKYLADMLKKKGGRLAAGFGVHMPYNYITPSLGKSFYKSFKLRETDLEKQRKMFFNWHLKCRKIYEYVLTKELGEIESKADAIENLVDHLHLRETLQKSVWLKISGYEKKTDLPFMESLHLMDAGFHVDDKCDSCGICAKVCPVKDIEMVDGKPVWQHRCEQCFACLQWCPQEAIQFGEGTSSCKRYHHPDVCLEEMMLKR